MYIRLNRSRFLQTVGFAALLVFASLNPAYAQNSDVNARMKRIENEIDTLSRAIFKGETPPAGSFSGNDTANADVQNRLTQIQMDLQALTGKIEEQSYEINRLKDLETRLNAMENRPQANTMITNTPATVMTEGAYGGVGMTTTATPPVPTAPANSSYTYSSKAPKESAALDEGFTLEGDPHAPAPMNAPTAGQLGTIATTVDQSGNVVGSPQSPTEAYEAAYTMLQNQDYNGAQVAFDRFIKQNPGNSLVPNAMYWLGETYYVRGKFPEATRTFAEAYQKYPKGAKAPDNLLKLAMSLNGQGKPKDACVALAQLKKEYPAGAAPVLTRADQEIERLKCSSL